MKKLLLLIPFLTSLAFAAPQNMGQMSIGFPVDASGGPSNNNLSTATSYSAFGFITNGAETLSEVTVYYSGTTGTPTAAGSVCELHADNSGDPAVASTETKTLAGAPSGAGAQTWTGFTTAITANTYYWIVFKNATATPASNFQTLQYFQNQPATSKTSSNFSITGANTAGGFVYKSTTDGTTYSSGGNNPLPAFGIKLKFSSGRYLGYLITDGSQDTGSTVYATRRWGAKFTIPSTWPTINLGGASMQISNTGTKPASGLKYEIYSGSSTTPSLVANCTSASRAAVNISGAAAWTPIYFPTTCVLTANQTYRLVMAIPNGVDGSASNEWRLYRLTLENSASTKAQLPFGGIAKTYSTDGVTFADTDTEAPPFQLFLDSTGEFTVSSGSATARSLISGDID